MVVTQENVSSMDKQMAMLTEMAENITGNNPKFIRDLNAFVSFELNSSVVKNFQYATKSKEIISFPKIGLIGYYGLRNVHNQPVYTCARYILLQGAMSEIERAEYAQFDLLERVQKGRWMIDHMEPSKQEAARQSLEAMSNILNLLTAGIELVKDMMFTMNNTTTSLDYRYNPVALDMCKYYLKSK